jgi:TRAP-type mannitol/chloroaromatic compound transport system permease small subunit
MTFLLRTVVPAIDAIGRGLAMIAIVQTVMLIAVMLYEVVARYVFDAPTLWANDITYMINGTLFLLGAAATLRVNAHVRIDFLSARLPLRAQHAIGLAFYVLLFLPILWIITNSQINKTWRAFAKQEIESMSAWEPLIWPFYAGISIGLIGLMLQVAAQAIRHGVGVTDPAAVPAPSATEVDIKV